MKGKLIFILIFIPALSFAKPTYMNCFVKNEAGEKHFFYVLADQDNRKITHKNENGNTFNTEAFFTKDTVRYLYNVNSSGSRYTFAYLINLSSLVYVSSDLFKILFLPFVILFLTAYSIIDFIIKESKHQNS